ncbi:alpha/beta hydrolase [Qiania dongpingensis]|uniref:Alpha/beta hydrolase n=1 Tax=Qiania dongpingensis TaxID=2763669 RepID=A0A7G9G1M2_9FIRM|nr:alpha/beta hydrolase [Qiania dongpingensis]QNM04704.1 alpha/beta hydrolase [Qiania dongpingensis]
MHKKKWLKRTLIILAVLLAAAYVVACNVLIDLALIPEKMEQAQAFEDLTEEGMEALVQTDDIQENRAEAISRTKKWLQSADTELLSVTTEDGYRLVAQAFYQERADHRWVLLLHGYTGWKEELYPIAYRYVQQGYQVLAPDMRCSGDSEGDFIGMGWTDRLDNQLWLDVILEKDPDAEIVLHGQSMGASCALMMGGEKLPANVKAIVSDSAYTDVYSIFKKQLKEWFHLPAFPLLDGANLMLKLRGGYDLKKASALNAVKECPLPILIIHGVEDAFVPVEMAQELYDAAAGDKELLLMEGAGHAQAPDKAPDEYYGTVFSFLERYGVR